MQTGILVGLAVAVLGLSGCSPRNGHSWSFYSSGDLKAVTNVEQKGEIPLDLKTLEVENRLGSIRLVGADNGPMEGSLQGSTSFGVMDVEARGCSLVCRNQNGAIAVRALSTALTNLEAITSFGSLEVRLPGALQPAITARTSFAEVESDFSVLLKNKGTEALADASLDAPRVRLENQNGLIRIVRD